MAKTKGALLPVYVLADESGSMAPHEGDLSSSLDSLCEGLRAEPMVAAELRLTVLGFSDDVQVRLAMTDMRHETSLPKTKVRGLSSYGAAFEDLLTRIPADVRRLRDAGYQVNRPAVFFLSDGQPTDKEAWRQPHGRLTDRAKTPTAPDIVACGIGDALASTMAEVATRPEFAFVVEPVTDIGQAVAEFFHPLTASLGHALGPGAQELMVPRPALFGPAIDEAGR
ncbi:hypothetical protein ACFYW1_34865 [Streptomyces sp. NPDC002669]|uniref:vWA domain-containing protein n=1 Tax=Streptomyces sp. NPDC002669 TaxID=3364658 RepID=UPI0036BB83F4